MISETTIPGIDVSRDWLDGFCLPVRKRFRFPNTADGHVALVAMIQQLSGPVRVGFEATGVHEWVFWTELIDAEIIAVQLPPARIKAFALSRSTLAKIDQFDAELIARFMAFRPEAGRELPDENIRIHRTLTTRKRQLIDMRKRLKVQISARRKQGVSANVEIMDDELKEVIDTQKDDIERLIEDVTAQAEPLAATASLLRPLSGPHHPDR